MLNFVAWWVKNPVAANLLMLGIIISGWLGLKNIEKEAFPSVNPALVQVEVAWQGASPQELEQQVIQRIEDALETVASVYRVNAEAREGFGSVTVESYANVDLNSFTNDVKNAVDSITSLPRDIENPRVRRFEWRQEMLRVAVVGDIGERALTRLAQDLREDFAAQPYIARVEVFGARQEEVTIELSESAMRRYGLTFEEVAMAVRANSINVSSGKVKTPTGDIQLRVLNLAEDQIDFESIVVRQTRDGGRIRIGDVARVNDGFEENEILATLNGKPAVLLQVQTTDDMQIVKSSKSAARWIEETQAQLPEGV